MRHLQVGDRVQWNFGFTKTCPKGHIGEIVAIIEAGESLRANPVAKKISRKIENFPDISKYKRFLVAEIGVNSRSYFCPVADRVKHISSVKAKVA